MKSLMYHKKQVHSKPSAIIEEKYAKNLKRFIIDTTDKVHCFECEYKANNVKSLMYHKKQAHSKP